MNLNWNLNNAELLIIVSFWEVVWKGLALWRAAKHEEKYWFTAILFINSAGILPILYLLYKTMIKKPIQLNPI